MFYGVIIICGCLSFTCLGQDRIGEVGDTILAVDMSEDIATYAEVAQSHAIRRVSKKKRRHVDSALLPGCIRVEAGEFTEAELEDRDKMWAERGFGAAEEAEEGEILS